MRWILFILFCLLGAPAHGIHTRRYNHNDNGLND